MKITVKSLQGDEYVVEAKDDDSVFDLKVKISEKPNGPAVCRQKLVYKGTTMQESNKIGEYNLVDCCKVHLILKKDDTNMPQQTSIGPFSTLHANTSATSTASISKSTSSPSSPCSMNTISSGIRNSNDNFQSVASKCSSNNLRLHKEQSSSIQTASSVIADHGQKRNISHTPSRFEVILRERLAKHFDTDAVEKIMANLQHEIDADINSSSLDDLERMAKQKLNISNE